MATAGVMLFKGPQARRYTQKAVPTQGGAHKRRPVATAGVMLFKGPQARRYTQNAVPTQGGAHKRRPVATTGVMLFKGPQARRYTQKAVPTQGGAHKRRPVATAGVMLFKGPQARRYTQNAVRTKGGRRFGRPISAGRTTARQFGRPAGWPNRRNLPGRRCRPNFRPKSSAAVSAGRYRPAEPPPSFSAEDRRRAPPPFHSDELPPWTPPLSVCVSKMGDLAKNLMVMMSLGARRLHRIHFSKGTLHF